ncbi:hypothetical protein NDU88_005318 [Pleurodeles waltl]|uniref:Uncharacterized protein n=1 Tax=Pleurodeles waltl TaxID=8319 RepID=A0AAV7V7K2_PLEWA|nr:hypothetical protein NDU88_005318 [Pleurodeles waltl]
MMDPQCPHLAMACQIPFFWWALTYRKGTGGKEITPHYEMWVEIPVVDFRHSMLAAVSMAVGGIYRQGCNEGLEERDQVLEAQKSPGRTGAPANPEESANVEPLVKNNSQYCTQEDGCGFLVGADDIPRRMDDCSLVCVAGVCQQALRFKENDAARNRKDEVDYPGAGVKWGHQQSSQDQAA